MDGLLHQGDPETSLLGGPDCHGTGRGLVRQSCSAAGVEEVGEVHEGQLRADLAGQLVVQLAGRVGAIEGLFMTNELGEEVLLPWCQGDSVDIEEQRNDRRHDGGRDRGGAERYQQAGDERADNNGLYRAAAQTHLPATGPELQVCVCCLAGTCLHGLQKRVQATPARIGIGHDVGPKPLKVLAAYRQLGLGDCAVFLVRLTRPLSQDFGQFGHF
jgi:hypothetical protein